jgi:Mg/Co/Ni transporter MgtE
MGFFSGEIERAVVLALFIPLIISASSGKFVGKWRAQS